MGAFGSGESALRGQHTQFEGGAQRGCSTRRGVGAVRRRSIGRMLEALGSTGDGTGRLDVGEGHRLHWETTGAVEGSAALVLHGGPGSGGSPALARGFDPQRYRVVAFDQRGAGRSTPRGETRHNRTELLIADIEALRHHLGIERWLVVGGSWGATLALAYAARHPEAVDGLLLRGLFVPSASELHWSFEGARATHAEAGSRLAGAVSLAGGAPLLPALCRVFAGDDLATQSRATLAWLAWEHAQGGQSGAAPEPQGDALQRAIDRYKVMAHYLAHRCWLADGDALRDHPVLFLHGELDRTCRPAAARAVQRLLPASRFETVPGAGHDPFHPAMAQRMARALDAFAARGRFDPPVQNASVTP
jgi:proline iminopeptidase